MLLLPVVIDQWTIGRVCGVAGVWLFCGLLLAGFWLPPRWGYWAFRAFGGLVFVAYAAYAVNQVVFGDQPIRLFGSKSEMSSRNALLGLIVFGLPGLWYALLGRCSLLRRNGVGSDPKSEDDEA
jgi:hypothetical protein